MTSEEFQVSGENSAAPFTLKIHRGDEIRKMNPGGLSTTRML